MTAKPPKSPIDAPDGAEGVVSRAKTDWEAVERSFRAGLLSLREIANEHGISEGAIRKRAKRDDWTRNLAAKVQARADALVRKEMVRTEVRTDITASEKQTIEIGATVVARVKISQRTDILRCKTLAMRLLEELEQQTAQVPELAQLGELMAKPDDKGVDKLNELYHKIISLPVRTKTMKDLSDTLKTLIGLERQAYGMEDGDGDDPPPGAGIGRSLSDAERAVRLARVLAGEAA